MALVCGVEEAGRGPVIGPMVMCGVLIEEADIPKLKSIGAKDSKLLTSRTREILYSQITRMVVDYKIVIISPKEIDDALNSTELNLNWLEAITSAGIINALNPTKATLDCPSNNDAAYTNYVKKHLNAANKHVKIISEHKADLHYPEVSAASILAKVTRDREIIKLKEKYKMNFGSGYPSDAVTRGFLEKYYNDEKYSSIFRKTWAPYKNLLLKKNQKNLGDF